VCTPDWIKKHYLYQDESLSAWGRHLLIVFHYDHEKIKNKLIQYLDSCTGRDWMEVAQKVARIGAWEFEDYKP
jgi:hypothetical protein